MAAGRDARVDALAAFCEQTLGAPSEWPRQVGYPKSLALCVLDSIWSLAVNYDKHVVPVLMRYRELRRSEGGDADTDSALELRSAIDRTGGAEAFADRMKNHQLTSSRGGIRKAKAVELAAIMLADRGIETPAQLRAAAHRDADLLKAWRSIPGQRSSLTGWRYLLLLAGTQEVKPDRMIRRFVNDALGLAAVTEDDAHDLVTQAAAILGVEPRELDHQIWRYQSGRTRFDEIDSESSRSSLGAVTNKADVVAARQTIEDLLSAVESGLLTATMSQIAALRGALEVLHRL